MKKFMLSVAVIAAIGFTSCSSDDDGDGGGAFDCADATQDAADAATAYAEDQSTANCNAYKSALQDLLDEECITGANATTTQVLIDSLTCD